MFCNCQGLRPNWKEPQNYLPENQIDILTLNETYLQPKHKFHLPGYDIYKNDRLVGIKGGVAVLVTKGIIAKQRWKNEHFNVITYKTVIFLGGFNSKHKQFGCVRPNKSGQTLVDIAKDLKLFYLNSLSPNSHMHEDPVHGTADLLDMVFLSPCLSSRDTSHPNFI